MSDRQDFLVRQVGFLTDGGASTQDAAALLGAHVDAADAGNAVSQFNAATQSSPTLAVLLRHASSLGLDEPKVWMQYRKLAGDLAGLRRTASAGMRGLPFYLLSITAVGALVVTILLIFVMPQFEALFRGFGADLPALTRLVIDLSRFGIPIFLIALPMFAWLTYESLAFKRITSNGEIPHWYSWKYSVMGAVTRRHFDVVHLWLVDLALKSTRSGEQALAIAATVMREISPKLTLDGLDRSTLPEELALSVRLGTLERELAYRAEYLLLELPAMTENQLDKISFLVKVIIGVCVGIIVIAMYLPIFRLGSAI